VPISRQRQRARVINVVTAVQQMALNRRRAVGVGAWIECLCEGKSWSEEGEEDSCSQRDETDDWWPAVVLAVNDDGTFSVGVLDLSYRLRVEPCDIRSPKSEDSKAWNDVIIPSWNLLKGAGWTHHAAPLSCLQSSWRYCRPGVAAKGADIAHGQHYFHSPAEAVKWAVSNGINPEKGETGHVDKPIPGIPTETDVHNEALVLCANTRCLVFRLLLWVTVVLLWVKVVRWCLGLSSSGGSVSWRLRLVGSVGFSALHTWAIRVALHFLLFLRSVA